MTTQTRSHVRPNGSRSYSTTGKFSTYVFLFVCLGYFILPLFWLLISSTKTNAGLFNSFGFWFAKDFGLAQNLKDLFTYQDAAFIGWMKNTAIYAISAAVGSSLISALAGYAFSQYRFAGRSLLFGIVLASVFVPGTVFAIPLYLLISKTGLSGSLLAVILPSLISPFGVYLMRIYSEQAIPEELLDAARIDGAGEFRIFATIAFRLLLPGYVTVLLFAFVGEQLLPAITGLGQIRGVSGHCRLGLLEFTGWTAVDSSDTVSPDHHRFGGWNFAGHDSLSLPPALLAKWLGFGEYQRLNENTQVIRPLSQPTLDNCNAQT